MPESQLLPFSLLFLFVPVSVLLALVSPLHILLLLNLALVVYPGQWEIWKVNFDPHDLLFASLALAFILRPTARRKILSRRQPISTPLLMVEVSGFLICFLFLALDLLFTLLPGTWQVFRNDAEIQNFISMAFVVVLVVEALRLRIPYMWLWVALGTIVSVAYVNAPINGSHMTSPVAVGYQLYRYCWRPILFYPLAVLLIDDRQKLETALLAIVLSGAACALLALPQGYAGAEATGPFNQKNALGGALVMPFIIALGATLVQQRRWQWGLYLLSLLLMARGLLFAGSRGAFVAVLGGVAFLLCWFWSTPYGRATSVRLVSACIVLGAVGLTLKPNLLNRPNVQHFFTIRKGTDVDTMQWRMQERWPYFWDKALDNFWLGTGVDYDPVLGDSADTPHNGYLGIAVISGVPSIVLLVLLAVLGIRSAFRAFRRSVEPRQKTIAITIVAAILGLLIHNVVDEIFRNTFPQNVLWLLAAMAIGLARSPGMLLSAAANPSSVPLAAPANALQMGGRA